MGYDNITLVYENCNSTGGPGRHIPRGNLGREGGTYLQHIVDRYDDLAEWTVFSQAGEPTYGYRGHRNGGGHMMSNVRFQDYVDAAQTRATRPSFFVLTAALMLNRRSLWLTVRRGFNTPYHPTPNASWPRTMCGVAGDWNRWFHMGGFVNYVLKLQQEQHAPIQGYSYADITRLFEVKIRHHVVLHAQGARFAASREAIRRRPRSYYERLLAMCNHSDPWVGYYLEWMWWYIIDGEAANCNMEQPIAGTFVHWLKRAVRADIDARRARRPPPKPPVGQSS